MGFLRLADAQRLFDEPDLISVISFKVDDLESRAGDRATPLSRPRVRAT